MATKTLREILAKNMRDRRKEMGISQEDFAELMKINRNYPGKIERCELNVRIEMVNKIAKVFKVSVCVMFGGKKIPTRRVKITTLFAENAKKIRLEKGFSQDYFKKHGYHRTYISSMEKGKNVTVDTVEKLAKALKVKPYELFE